MFINNLKIAYRNLIRNKGYSFINIFGLAVGLSTTILLLMWVDYNISYDKFHKNRDYLYQIVHWQKIQNTNHASPSISGRLVNLLAEKTPEIKNATNYTQNGNRYLITVNETRNYEQIHHADPDFFRMFSFPLLKGTPEKVFEDPYSMVISEKIAEKYFGKEDPIGKIVKLNNKYDIRITGVVKNLPPNSLFNFDIAMPFEFFRKRNSFTDNWNVHAHYGFVQLNKNANIEDVNNKIKSFYTKHVSKEATGELSLFPLTQTHLYSFDGSESNIKEVRLFMIIALFILLIACINYMNLSTAKATKRAKEIGLKKAIGSSRAKLIRQFLFESVIVSFIALNFAIIITRLFLPSFNNILKVQLLLDYSDWRFLLGLLTVTLITGLLAGSYPSFYLSRYNPILVLKGTIQSGKKRGTLRKILVIFQFSLSIILLVCTITIALQTLYLNNKSTGINKSDVIFVMLNKQLNNSRKQIKEELISDPSIENITHTSNLPIDIGMQGMGYEWNSDESTRHVQVALLNTDYEFDEVFKVPMKEGRFFNKEHFNADTNNIVINETLAKMISEESALDKTIDGMYNLARNSIYNARIIGVVKDFNFKSLHKKIDPLIIYPTDQYYYMLIRIAPNNNSRALEHVKNVCQKYNTDQPPVISFLEDSYNNLYKKEQSTLVILKYFTILAIFISCLGLFGLATFMAEERTKEIGIRKVMGASVIRLVGMSTTQFIYWVILANIVAWPIAWYFMKEWLKNFAFHIDMPWWVFIAVAALVIVISIATVGYQSWRAATQDPVKNLRSE